MEMDRNILLTEDEDSEMRIPRRSSGPFEPVKMREYSQGYYATPRQVCILCPDTELPELYTVYDLFVHIKEFHGLIICTYCPDLRTFNFSKQLMVHLHREHRIITQRFDSQEHFLRSGGRTCAIVCPECNQVVQPAEAAAHVCSNGALKQLPVNRKRKLEIAPPADRLPKIRPTVHIQKDMEVAHSEPLPIDPLLLEDDPDKRLNMLIEELCKKIEDEKTDEVKQSEKYVVLIGGSLQDRTDFNFLLEMLRKSSSDCLYCRQASLINVDKRQLLIHLLIKHNWEIRSCPYSSTLSAEASTNTKENVKVKTEDLVEKTEDTKLKNPEDSEHSIKVEKMEIPEDNVLEKETTDSKQEPMFETDTEPKPEPSIHSEDKPETKPTFDKSNSTEITWEEFKSVILQKVFHSSDLIFSWQRETNTNFGGRPCECLICGFQVESEQSLFPHWRKNHRGVSMKCVMCCGRFLFAGALFSHLCLGTPEPFVAAGASKNAYEVDRKEGDPDPKDNGEVCVRTDGYANTLILRYECGLCKDKVQLPGFFNYMIHIRKHHYTCELCLETVKSQKDLELHVRKHKLNHFCWKCSVTYLAMPNFMTHLFWKHGTESQECSLCLKKKWPHIYHFCIPPTNFICEVCGLVFTKPKALAIHRRLHTNQNLRKCPTCPEKFISKKLLDKHVLAGHEKKALQNGSALVVQNVMAEDIKDVAAEQPNDTAISTMNDQPDEKEQEKEQADQDQCTQKGNVSENESEAQRSPPKPTDACDKVQENHVGDESAISVQTSSEEKHQPVPQDMNSINLATELDLSSSDEENEKQTNQLSKDTSDTSFGSIMEQDSLEPESKPATQDNEEPSKPEEKCPISPSKESHELDRTSKESSIETTPALPEEPVKLPEKEALKIPQTPLNHRSSEKYGLLLSSDDEDDIEELNDDFKALSPLLPSLEDYSLRVPELPQYEGNPSSLPEHIRREHVVRVLRHDHYYCKSYPEDNVTSSSTPSASVIQPKQLGKLPKSPPRKVEKKRRHESSSSSSSSSSSCSSCGSNCSCSGHSSSSSSSDSDSDHGPDPSPQKKIVKAKSPVKAKPKGSAARKEKHTPVKKLKISVKKDPSVPKRPVGRPPKYPRTPIPRKTSEKSHASIKEISSAESKMLEILKHFKTPEDAYILESDLDSDDSGSEERFNRKQEEETFTQAPQIIDEVWTEGNEKFLLKYVRGVKNLEELRRRPKLLAATKPTLGQIGHYPTQTTHTGNYSVFTKSETNGRQPRLKVRNVPIKPLIVKRNFNNQAPFQNDATTRAALMRLPPPPKFPSPMRGRDNLQNSPIRFQRPMHMVQKSPIPRSPSNVPASVNAKFANQKPFKFTAGQTTITPVPMQVNRVKAIPSHPLIPVEVSISTSPDRSQPSHHVEYFPPPETVKVVNANVTPISSPIETGKVTAPLQATVPPETTKVKTVTPQPTKHMLVGHLETKPTKSKSPMPRNKKVDKGVKKTYCICEAPHDNVSQMIGCDDKECPIEWFHFECVGVVVAPKGKWYCPDCSEKRKLKIQALKVSKTPSTPPTKQVHAAGGENHSTNSA